MKQIFKHFDAVQYTLALFYSTSGPSSKMTSGTSGVTRGTHDRMSMSCEDSGVLGVGVIGRLADEQEETDTVVASDSVRWRF